LKGREGIEGMLTLRDKYFLLFRGRIEVGMGLYS
jgi:hypothetical protein